MSKSKFVGDIPHIIRNVDGLYEGDLCHYLRLVCLAPNLHHGYHGLRHMLHVTWVCYEACVYYAKKQPGSLNARQMRNLLIGALMHDYDHEGTGGDDSRNIARANTGLRKYIHDSDRPWIEDIECIIGVTQFPHDDIDECARLEWQIIRDADMSQALSTAWMGDILAGLGSELSKTPREMLEQQLTFLRSLRFYTDFAQERYGHVAIDQKITEGNELLQILQAG